MSFTDLFVRRPVLASVVSLLILLIGLVAGVSLQIRQYPELSNTTITITTAYPGANADLIRGFITTPIEQAVASTEGLDTLVSSSRSGVSTVTLNLRLNANPDRAATDVLSKVNQVTGVLPEEASDPVVVKQTGDAFALMYISFNSDQMSSSQITDYITRVVQPKLQTVDGVSRAQIIGGQTFAMRVWLDPERMAALDVTPADVRNALAANNFVSATGDVKGDFVLTAINAETSLSSVEEFERLVVATRGDTLIRLSNVGGVELGPESTDSTAAFDGLQAVFIGIFATPGANPLTVIDGVRGLMPEVQRDLPEGMKGTVAYDSTEFIRASIDEVVSTLAEAAVIVIVVIFLFLGNLRATLIPIITIPLSLVGVMIMLLALGYSLNLLTLLALVLAIGLVVDDAIVVVENIHRHIEEGKSRFEAALVGAREIALPVVAMTITLAAVYAPIGFVSGLTGALFREFAFTLAGAVVVSGIVALTLSPMMCSKLLVPSEKQGRFAHWVDSANEWVSGLYARVLRATLAFRLPTLIVLAGTIAMTGLLYVTTPSELAPQEDQGIVFSLVKTPQYANLDYLEHTTEELAKVYATSPDQSNVFAINGFEGIHQGFVGMLLKPWGERDKAAGEILGEMQPKLEGIPTGQVLAFQPPPLPGSSGGAPIQFVLTTTADYTQLAEVLSEVQNAARQSGLFLFTDSDLKFDTPQVEVSIDQDKANNLGITMQDVGIALATLLAGGDVNRFNLYGRSYKVIPQLPRSERLTPDQLETYQLRTASGTMVPLSTVVSLSSSVQPNALTSFQQLNSATLSGVPFPGRTVGEAIQFLEERSATLLPEGFSYDFQGQSRQYVQEGDTLVYTFVFALIVIFLVLAAQFESWRDPLVILVALPTSMFGALLPLNIGGVMGLTSINIYTQIGLVTLIGLISKHGILMVEFANNLQEEQGLGRMDAIVESARTRLRPILMTTAAMVVAMVPLLTASGAGSQSRFAIGLVIAAGMTVGTLFTLFVTPAVYSLIARDHNAHRGELDETPPAGGAGSGDNPPPAGPTALSGRIEPTGPANPG